MCKHSYKCWRRAYSEYYLKVEKYSVPPKRDVIFLAGFVSLEMMPKKGIYCNNMPSQQSEVNLCPSLMGYSEMDCKEFQMEEKRLANLKVRATSKFQNRSVRVDIPKEVKKRIAAEHNYKCVYCGIAAGQYRPNGNRAKCVIDHYIPLAQGGHPTDPGNLVLSCEKCNGDKKAQIWAKGCRLNERYQEKRAD